MPLPYKLGDQGPEIQNWQAWFTREYELCAPPEDGYYGDDEVAAVKEMQRRLFLPQTGVFDATTAHLAGYTVPPVALPIMFTIEGHTSDMFAGPVADTGSRLEAEGICHHQPIGYNNGALPFDNQSDALAAAGPAAEKGATGVKIAAAEEVAAEEKVAASAAEADAAMAGGAGGRGLGAGRGLMAAAGPIGMTLLGADFLGQGEQAIDRQLGGKYLERFAQSPLSAIGVMNMISGRAGGGPLHAPGPKGKDSALFWGASGEHVLTADDVDAMGGHGAVYAMRNALHREYGGAVGPDVQAAYSMMGTRYSQGARNDCSGMVGRVILGAMGLPASGLPTTQNMGQWLAALGFKSGIGGPGQISVGWYNHGSAPNDGHAAMTLSDGENAESGGSHGNFLVGAGAAGASSAQFDHHMYLPTLFGEGAAGGMPGGFGGAGGGGFGGGLGGGGIPAGATAGTGPGGQSGYYTQNPAKVASAQERLRHLDQEIANAEERRSELKSDASKSTRDRLDEEIRHLRQEKVQAEQRLQEAQQGTFHALRGHRGDGLGMGGLPVPLADRFGLSKGLPGLAEWAVGFLSDLLLAPLENAFSAAMGGGFGDVQAFGAGLGMPPGPGDFGFGAPAQATLDSFIGPAGGGGGVGGAGVPGPSPSGGGAPSAGGRQSPGPGHRSDLAPGIGNYLGAQLAPARVGPGIRTQNDYKLWLAGVIDSNGNVISGPVGPGLSGLLQPPRFSSGAGTSPMLVPGDTGLLGGGQEQGPLGLQGGPPSYPSGPSSRVPPQTLLPPLAPPHIGAHFDTGGPVPPYTGTWVQDDQGHYISRGDPDNASTWNPTFLFPPGSGGVAGPTGDFSRDYMRRPGSDPGIGKWKEYSGGPLGLYNLPGGGIGSMGPNWQGLHAAAGGLIGYFAQGGPSGTDTVPAWLSPGEFVTRSSAVQNYGLSFMNALNQGRVDPRSIQYFDDGGAVKSADPTAKPPPAPKPGPKLGPPGEQSKPGMDVHQPGAGAPAVMTGAQIPQGAQTRQGLAQPGESKSLFGQDLPPSGGIGFGGGLLGAAEGAASQAAGMAASMGTFGAGGGAASSATDLIFQLANRTAAYGAQSAGIAVEAALETFLPSDSPLSNISNTLPGKILAGIAGARPAQPNTAGQTKAPLTSEQAGAGAGAGGAGGGGGIGVQINGMSVQPANFDQFHSDLQRLHMGAQASYPMNTP